MTHNELEKYVGRWISFTQIDNNGDYVGTVNKGKLLKTWNGYRDVLVCCFDSLDNPKAVGGFSWIGRPKEYNRSWAMFTGYERTQAFKDFKTATIIGEL